MLEPAIVLANHYYLTPNGKGAHGLVRGSERFRVVAVVDPDAAGRDAGEILDGTHRNIPVVGSIDAALRASEETPRWCVVGIATHGGRFSDALRALLVEAAEKGLSIVNGLHDAAADEPAIAAAAAQHGGELVDLPHIKPRSELHFWEGHALRTPRIAVLGTDCALGKRTTARLLVGALNAAGVRAEMIYTGQTGWMQGARYGFILDSTPNDYVCDELEHALLTCEREAAPEVMVIEGQSSLRNPSGPCGAELLLAGGARGVVLQHAVGREHFEGFDTQGLRIPPLAEELELIRLYGARTLAITLNGRDASDAEVIAFQQRSGAVHGVPVVRPLEEGLGALLPVVRRYLADQRDDHGAEQVA